jgi:hypothetical protein
MGGLMEFVRVSRNHFHALTIKNLRLYVRRWKATLLTLSMPVLGVLVLWVIAHAVHRQPLVPSSVSGTLRDRPSTAVPTLKALLDYPGQISFGETLLYSPDNSFTRSVMQGLALAEGISTTPLGFDDIEGAGTAWYQAIWKSPPLAYIEFMSTTSNITSYVVHGDIDDQYRQRDSSDEWEALAALRPGYVSFSHFKLALQRAVDNSIIEVRAGAAPGSMKIDAAVAPFALRYWDVTDPYRNGDPTVSRRILDALSPVIIFMSLLIPFLVSVQMLMHEKQVKVMGMMRVVGLKEGAYWLSWYAALLLPPLIFSLPCILLGLATGVNLFARTNFFVLYVTYVFSSAGLNAMACAVSAPFAKPRYAYGIAFFVVVLGLVMGIVFGVGTLVAFSLSDAQDPYEASSRPTFSDMLLYDPHSGKHGLLAFFELLPPFHFIRILEVITATTSDSYFEDSDYNTVKVPGSHFGWHLFSNGRSITSCCDARGNSYTYISGAPSRNIGLLVATSMMYLVIAWYSAQVSDTDNGTPKRWYFPLSPEYWGYRAPPVLVQGDTLARVRDESLRAGSIRLHKVSKTFKDSTALKELTMELCAGEVFCLLGQNGAGKTTAINLITGQTGPTHGKAFVRGLDVETQMDDIRPLIGLCPQHDVLWPDLTAEEHLRFYSKFRGVPDRDAEVGRAFFFFFIIYFIFAKKLVLRHCNFFLSNHATTLLIAKNSIHTHNQTLTLINLILNFYKKKKKKKNRSRSAGC